MRCDCIMLCKGYVGWTAASHNTTRMAGISGINEGNSHCSKQMPGCGSCVECCAGWCVSVVFISLACTFAGQYIVRGPCTIHFFFNSSVHVIYGTTLWPWEHILLCSLL